MNIKEIQEKIDYYEQKINNAELEKATLQGKQQVLVEQLKTDFDINDLSELDGKIQELKEETDILNEQIENVIVELECFDILQEE